MTGKNPVKVSKPPGAWLLHVPKQNRWEICGERLMGR